MDEVIILAPDLSNETELPFVDGGIKAGFPSPAQDYALDSLDINSVLITNKASSFYAHVVGDSMLPGIEEGDYVLVDRSIDPFQNCIAVCYINNEFNIKRLDLSEKEDKKVIRLISDNPKYAPIIITPDDNFIIWGVVKYAIHKTI